ncbi:MAG TPA: porin family protein [Gammaproteobacteria bacterium]|nr:porin family protein [Gammaproteobacteria bacterium]
MRRAIPTTVLSLTLAAASGATWAQGWKPLAGADPDYRSEPTVALVGGTQDPDFRDADSDGIYGIELSFNCPLLQPPTHRIRQQLSLTEYDEDGLELTSLELNPHYVVPVAQGLEIGFGPGLALIDAEAGRDDETLWGLQAGASLHYRVGELFAGAEYRYQITSEGDFGNARRGDEDVDNSRFLLKLGINM